METLTIIQFPQIGSSEQGFLSVAQLQHNVPFIVQRIFWIYHTPEQSQRGNHAHYKMSQVLIAMSGTIHIYCESADQSIKQTITLDNPTQGLLLPAHIRHSMTFESNATLLSLSSTEYQEDDYIRDYDTFREHYR